MKFSYIFPDFESFKVAIIDKINLNENTPFYLNDESFSYTQESLFRQLVDLFGNAESLFSDKETFINSFSYRYSESMMNFYTKVSYSKLLDLKNLSKEFYKTIAENSSESTHNASDINISMNSITPNNIKFSDMVDDLGINNAAKETANNLLNINSKMFASTENKYRLFKNNESSELKTYITIFLNSFSEFFTMVGTSGDISKNPDYVFNNGYFVREVPYLGLENQTNIDIIAKAFLKLNELVQLMGPPGKVLDREEQLYKFIDEFKIDTWDGLTAQEIFLLVQEVLNNMGIAWLATTNFTIDQLTFEPVEVAGKITLDYYLSKQKNNKGNKPDISPDWWTRIPEKDIPFSELVEAMKPFIISEVKRQIEDIESLGVGKGLEIVEGAVQVDGTIATKDDLGNFVFTPKVGRDFASMKQPGSFAQIAGDSEMLNFNVEDPENPQIKMKQKMDCLDNPITNLPDAVEDKDALPLGQAKQMIEDIPSPPALDYEIVEEIYEGPSGVFEMVLISQVIGWIVVGTSPLRNYVMTQQGVVNPYPAFFNYPGGTPSSRTIQVKFILKKPLNPVLRKEAEDKIKENIKSKEVNNENVR